MPFELSLALWLGLCIPASLALTYRWAARVGSRSYYSTPHGLEPGLSPEVSLPFYKHTKPYST